MPCVPISSADAGRPALLCLDPPLSAAFGAGSAAMNIFDVYAPFFRHFRGRRLDMFLQKLKPSAEWRMLDVGGYPSFWTQRAQPVGQIVCLNVHEVAWDGKAFPSHRIETMVGDGCRLPFPDGSFDIVFSNSVIEHVGDWARQQAFAREALRVGRRVWVQTPAYECLVEPHYIAPFVHYLPRGLQRRTLRWCTPWGWLQRPSQAEVDHSVDSIRLLKKREMLELFPGCELLTEKWFGMPKSYIAVKNLADR